MSTREQVHLVTGASSGIGQATAVALAKTGARVVMVARSEQKGSAAADEVRHHSNSDRVDLMLADLSSQESVRALVTAFNRKYDRLDVLINNAAIIPRERQTTVDGIEMQLAVNHLAYFILATELLGKLTEGTPGRVVNVSSALHRRGALNFDDLQAECSYGRWGWGQYSNTKLMNALFTVELARRTAGTGLTANYLHPGVIDTGLSRDTPLASVFRVFLKKPDTGAETSVFLATSEEVAGVTGKYFEDCSEAVPSQIVDDPQIAKRLWDKSAELVAAR